MVRPPNTPIWRIEEVGSGHALPMHHEERERLCDLFGHEVLDVYLSVVEHRRVQWREGSASVEVRAAVQGPTGLLPWWRLLLDRPASLHETKQNEGRTVEEGAHGGDVL